MYEKVVKLAEEKKVSRRSYVKYAAAGVVIVGGAAAGAYYATRPTAEPTPTPGPPPGEEMVLDFVMWAANTPLQERNMAEFSKAYQRDAGVNLKCNLTSIPYDAYKASIISRFEGGTKTDVLYVEDNWFSLWENAGWIEPIEKYRPYIATKYKPDLVPGVLDALISRHPDYKGLLIGLPYYVDTLTFMYNKDMTDEAGLDEPPTTWDEVLDHAEIIKNAGILDRPISFAWKLAEWTFEESTFAMLYSRGEKMLNPDGTANLDEGSAMHQVLQWIEEGGAKRKVIDTKSAEFVSEDVLNALKGRVCAYTVLPSYFLFFTNVSDAPGAGQVVNAMMPGNSDTTELVRFYALTNQAQERGEDFLDACASFMEWEGGMYDRMGIGEEVYIKPKEYALSDGLPFGLIGLFDDPAVKNSMQGWVDQDIFMEQFKQTFYIGAKWELFWEEWRPIFEREVQNVMAGVSTADESLPRIRDSWNNLKGS